MQRIGAPIDITTPASASYRACGLNSTLPNCPSPPGIVATASNDGILHITGNTGSNAFAVATVNLGISSAITATANTAGTNLPLTLFLCQTNPTSGQCTSSIGTSVATTINAGTTPTFAIFANATGSIPFVPQTNRIFVQFTDASGAVRGLTSVAVETP